ncbi:HD domain-containing protein [Saccharicrinis sp. FJH62]|uniref:HD domain-containing protein n=1 Tax=Saccharicrinis sp. FJH62 TaxID=3344657 RepID=UPI0035D4C574
MKNTGKLKRFITGMLNDGLNELLTYHGVHHTLHVLNVCQQYIKRMQVPPHEAYLLRTAALMHDTGYIVSSHNHEEESVKITRKLLPEWDYSDVEIARINGMIRATKIPQKPLNILECILADSDLDYLGTEAFYPISQTLYQELLNLSVIHSHEEWNKLQIKFLQNHSYHTPYAKKYREPVKQKYLAELLKSQS